MKKTFTILAAVLLTATVWAQIPEKFSYQAVIRDADNNLVVNQSIGMQVTILVGAGTALIETHTPTSNENGLISIEIGGGTLVSGIFESIGWTDDDCFIKTEVDPEGGTNYSITGTTQLLSVPYAMHAKTADQVDGIVEITGTTDDTENFVNVAFPAGYNNTNSYILSLQILNTPYINANSQCGLGYTATNGTLSYELTYFSDPLGGGITRRIKINYPDELKDDDFKLLLMKY